MSVSRSTVSFTEDNWKQLQSVPNKSKVVNAALKFYFDSRDYMKRQQRQFIEDELKHYDVSGEAYGFDETFE